MGNMYLLFYIIYLTIHITQEYEDKSKSGFTSPDFILKNKNKKNKTNKQQKHLCNC